MVMIRGVFLVLVFVPTAVTGVGADDYGGCDGTVPSQIIQATPATYQGLVTALQPGDLLRLAAGTYPGGLSINGLEGEPGNCIVIEGPTGGSPAVFTGSNSRNTVSIRDSGYLVIRNLTLDGLGLLGDGVKAEGTASWAHHITLENLHIIGHGNNQQIVGISTKCPCWNWVVRRNRIEGAGTGMYLGNSNGEDEFVNSLVEYNLIVDTIGYNVQFKHQNGRATDLGSPASGTTIFRHNVMSKASGGSSGGDARPNLLVGHWPLSGPGSDDNYLIYGNFFWQNPNEALFQGEGNIIFYDNLLVNYSGTAIRIQPHNDQPRRIRVFQNTVVASATGVSVSGSTAGFERRVVGNAVFAGTPISGGTQIDNIGDSYGAASGYLTNPDGVISGASDRLDLYPLPGTLAGTAIDLSGLTAYEDWAVDFNAAARPGTVRGGYAGEGANPGWLLALERKPKVDMVIFTDGFESGDTSAWSGVTN